MGVRRATNFCGLDSLFENAEDEVGYVVLRVTIFHLMAQKTNGNVIL
jgi:hypothetical protein